MKLRVIPVLVALAAFPTAAFAADPPKGSDPAAAQVLFYEARTLMGQNKWAEACPKLEESLRLDNGIGTAFNLADCNEHLGKVTTAWAGFLDAAAQSKASNQPDREKLARKRALALEPRLPKLVVEVSGAPQGLEVKRDGVLVGSAAWGTAIPVDPGTHKISASAPGKLPWETTVTSVEGKVAKVAIPRELPNAPAAPPVVAKGPTTPRPATDPAVTTAPSDAGQSFPPPVVESTGSTQRTLGWIITGVGAVGIGVGAGFGLSSLSKRDESRDHCVIDSCNETGVGLRDDAIQNGNIATIATIAGAAGVVGGLILVLTAPKGTESRTGKIRAVPSAGVGGGGFMLQGAF
jgi:hypothetical protein